MQVKKVEDFLEKLRTSKSRSVTIAILRPPIDATDEDIAATQEVCHGPHSLLPRNDRGRLFVSWIECALLFESRKDRSDGSR